MKKTTLLCTFTTKDALPNAIQNIQKLYDLAFGSIYVLQNDDDLQQLILTYNIIGDQHREINTSDLTISVHRKKHTNTIYTINALNKLIIQETGKLDKSYLVKWDGLKDTVLVTAYGQLKKIKISTFDIIKID